MSLFITPHDPASWLTVVMGIMFGGGMIWLSLQDTLRIGSRGFAAGDEFPNPIWFKIPVGCCGAILLVIHLWKLWLLWR